MRLAALAAFTARTPGVMQMLEHRDHSGVEKVGAPFAEHVGCADNLAAGRHCWPAGLLVM